MDKSRRQSFARALAWCYAWGPEASPQSDLSIFQNTRTALKNKQPEEIPTEIKEIISKIEKLQDLDFPNSVAKLREQTAELKKFWNAKIGLVYGGATKIKGYVFEAAKLPDIRGASAILDRINLIDLPAFFNRKQRPINKWLNDNFPRLQQGLIEELIVYSTGGNILAFCPAGLVDDLANAIEKRYTEETLTANSCAVGETFKMLEVRFGLLPDELEKTFWFDKYQSNSENELVKAYFYREKGLEEDFQNRKSFNELVGKLATQFNQRRAGNILPNNNRPSRRYPPMFETHPYLVADESDRRNAIKKVELPGEPFLSEALVRKRIFGQITKREGGGQQKWHRDLNYGWKTGFIDSWVRKFRNFIIEKGFSQKYYENLPEEIRKADEVKEAKSLREIANAEPVPTPGFVGYIYADGNNMGGYIQTIKTPEDYQQFSEDIVKATKESVYKAIAKHLQPRQIKNPDPDSNIKAGTWIHPFEIIAIGGDDVMLIVPADKALAIAQTIGEEFENHLVSTGRYNLPDINEKSKESHRYRPETAPKSRCTLSTSVGVLITADDTPIYYAEDLTNQLLKSAKTKAKELKNKTDEKTKEKYNYHGGTIDFLVMKSVTMLTSKVKAFREEGLTKENEQGPILKLYGSPYTLYEIGGLLETVKALKESDFSRSQIYQMRGFLEQGKKTAMLNYRYFRARLDGKSQKLLEEHFEEAWCKSKTNGGNLAPWMFLEGTKKDDKSIYETLWRELVDLHPFIEVAKEEIAEKEEVTINN